MKAKEKIEKWLESAPDCMIVTDVNIHNESAMVKNHKLVTTGSSGTIDFIIVEDL